MLCCWRRAPFSASVQLTNPSFINCLPFCYSQSTTQRRWDEPQLMNAFITGTPVTFWCSLEGGKTVRREKRPCSSSPGVNLLRVTNFTLCREKSAEALDFPACHMLLLNTERLIHFADGARKQLRLPNTRRSRRHYLPNLKATTREDSSWEAR